MINHLIKIISDKLWVCFLFLTCISPPLGVFMRLVVVVGAVASLIFDSTIRTCSSICWCSDSQRWAEPVGWVEGMTEFHDYQTSAPPTVLVKPKTAESCSHKHWPWRHFVTFSHMSVWIRPISLHLFSPLDPNKSGQVVFFNMGWTYCSYHWIWQED